MRWCDCNYHMRCTHIREKTEYNKRIKTRSFWAPESESASTLKCMTPTLGTRPVRDFCMHGFSYVLAPVFSTPAYSTCAIYSCFFHSCIFHSRIFSAPVLSSAICDAIKRTCSLEIASRYLMFVHNVKLHHHHHHHKIIYSAKTTNIGRRCITMSNIRIVKVKK